MKSKYNTFSFCQEDYKEYYECLHKKEVNFAKMYEDIAKFIELALTNGYQLKVWCDGLTVVIEYNYKDKAMTGTALEWLGDDEYIESCLEETEE